MRPATRREASHASRMRHFSHTPRRHPQALALHRSPRHKRRPAAPPTILTVAVAQIPRLLLEPITRPATQTSTHDFRFHFPSQRTPPRRPSHRARVPIPKNNGAGDHTNPCAIHPRHLGHPNRQRRLRLSAQIQYFTLQPYGCVVAFATGFPSFTAFNAAAT